MKKIYCLLAVAVLGLSACSTAKLAQIPSYKLKIIQGNELDQKVVNSLQPGMSREQVQMLLGTPLLRDPFHANRWDYLFVISRASQIQEERKLTLYFDANGKLIHAEGDAITAQPQPVSTAVPEKTE
ncbi:MAG: outer membrane protein assembly factor BamE [Snodgrassella sp.]|jgi:outer membrane protein assembly factor BamE|uniref:Outer membrane protein assembly factor BamE n=1 Tax=Snodgrassella communis TaxID=2946699 RepID=A0A066TL12_9NEIS|nr:MULTISPECIES: outer membrane protein assembly factor BamE [Snodgrassella]KDN11777.1 Outer membrane lipoprotein SmpA, a component of the essential YaeT outer-membrane protein assembly complex [Snodgrassella communis]KDN14207.1 Outer membrane lipoprotein SmpA, a component of the essential YaeT outer-membrane protein assembly complex [Snodgrassella communis]MCO6505764.1 outer membrane protein assembly factor BamE [Snodgrassella sp.]MCO6508825.1 outer membrane protein assembly factor BamE [Snodg